MRLYRIRSPLTPLNKGGTIIRYFVLLIKGDLGGAKYVQRPIKLLLAIESVLTDFSYETGILIPGGSVD